MKLTPLIQKAINFAAVKHSGQKRKAGDLPYIVHPFSVAWILADHTKDEEIIAAGLLHDILEDVPDCDFNELKKEFGARVADIVAAVSENKKIDGSWEERKREFINRLKTADGDALLVCAADKIHNLRSLAEAYKIDGEEVWRSFNATMKNKFWFYEEILKILRVRLENRIVDEMAAALEVVKKMVL